MARIRSLKPEFFTSDQVVSVSVEARYLFEGIWVFGDDEGLIKNSPKSLKMKVFPGDSIEVESLIEQLLREGLVVEVDSDQGSLLWVPTFHQHQSPRKPARTKFSGVGAPFVPHHSPESARSRGEKYGTGSAPVRHDYRTAPAPPRQERRGEEGKGEERNVSEVAGATRPDVERLLDLLDSELTKNGVSKLPKRNKTNRDAMRLLLDRDGRTEDQVAAAIRWCQSDEFWRGNILSAAKLREKYETLRAQAARGRRGPAVQDNLARLAQLEAEERAAEQGEIEE